MLECGNCSNKVTNSDYKIYDILYCSAECAKTDPRYQGGNLDGYRD